jgi:hypothetical protein
LEGIGVLLFLLIDVQHCRMQRRNKQSKVDISSSVSTVLDAVGDEMKSAQL